MKDFLGTEINVGDKVLYAGLAGRTAKLSRGFVVGRGDSHIRIIRLEEWSTNTSIIEGKIKRLDNIAVVGSIAVVQLDAVIEALAALADAEKKYYSREITYPERRDTEQVAIQVFKDLWG